ncbi:MAG: phytanoyl-CoA dioxygenase family protein [Thalassotalea sp.]
MTANYAQISAGKISKENEIYYRDNGYLIADDLISKEEIAALKYETNQIFRGRRGNIEGLLSLSENMTDEAVLKEYVAIHFPHKISPVIYNSLSHIKVTEILNKIISDNVKCIQSMLFVKGPGKSGQSWHQDEYFIPTRDCSLTGVWIAIDDATIENGCLWLIPGSNKPAYIYPRIENTDLNFADLDTVDVSGFSKQKIIPVAVKRGTVVFFNGYTLHSSLKNSSNDQFRIALVNHYMSAESMLPWDQDGKLPPTADLRDIVMVTGQDPYRHKGVVDINQPYLRPDVLDIKK